MTVKNETVDGWLSGFPYIIDSRTHKKLFMKALIAAVTSIAQTHILIKQID